MDEQDGDAFGEECVDCVVAFCCGGDTEDHDHDDADADADADAAGSGTKAAVSFCCFVLAVLAVVGLLVAGYVVVLPVRVTIDDAALGRLALAAPAPASGVNGTSTGTAVCISYDISVAVVIHNRNWAMSVWPRGPLDAELRFGGRKLVRSRLAAAGRGQIRPLKMAVYRLSATAEGTLVDLGPDAAAELAREHAAGVFDLELAVFLAIQYEAHRGRSAIRVTCPLRLSPSTATAPVSFTGNCA